MGTDLAGCVFQLFHFTGGELRPEGPLFPPRIRLEAERWLGPRALGFLLSISSFAREARQMQEQVRAPPRVCRSLSAGVANRQAVPSPHLLSLWLTVGK